MTDPLINESILELRKLIQMMDEDAATLTPATLISDYVAPILDSMVSEIELNRQAVIQTNDRVSLALMMAEKTFLGDILTSIAEHFSTIVEELPENLLKSAEGEDSKMGTALAEVQDLLATWMSFEMEDGEYLEEDDEDVEDVEEDFEESDDVEDDTSATQENEPSVTEEEEEVFEAEVITDGES